MNNYKLYKLVFCNIYIQRLIFKFVKIPSKDNIHPPKKYEDINLNFIVKTRNYELLKDKLKMAVKFNNSEIEFSLLPLLTNLKKDYQNDSNKSRDEEKEILIQIYNINNLKEFKEKNLVEIFIVSNCVYLLKQLYQDHLNDPERTEFKINRTKIKSNTKFYEKSLRGGDIELLEFLYFTLKIGIGDCSDELKNKALYWAIHSTNRDEVVGFLLDKMNYTIPFQNNGVFDNYFENFIKLEFKLVKRIVEAGSSILYINKAVFNDILQYSLPSSNVSKSIPLNKLIDFIQSSIYIIQTKNESKTIIKEYNYLLNKIKLLIQFNNSNNSNNRLIEEIKKIEEKQKKVIYSYSIVKSNVYSWGIEINSKTNTSSKKSFFSSIFPSIQRGDEKFIETFSKASNVKFDELDLEREVKRIYILDFLLPIIMNTSRCYKADLTIQTVSIFLINFSSTFREYNLILDFKAFFCRDLKLLINESSIIQSCQRVATMTANSELVQFLFNNFADYNKENDYQGSGLNNKITINFHGYYNHNYGNSALTPLLFNNELVPLHQQIKYLITLLKYKINYPVEIKDILFHICLKNQFNNGQLDEIANGIKLYNNCLTSKGSHNFSASIFTKNVQAGDYFYFNHKDLFSDWDNYFLKTKYLI